MFPTNYPSSVYLMFFIILKSLFRFIIVFFTFSDINLNHKLLGRNKVWRTIWDKTKNTAFFIILILKEGKVSLKHGNRFKHWQCYIKQVKLKNQKYSLKKNSEFYISMLFDDYKLVQKLIFVYITLSSLFTIHIFQFSTLLQGSNYYQAKKTICWLSPRTLP